MIRVVTAVLVTAALLSAVAALTPIERLLAADASACPSGTADFGSWCLDEGLEPLGDDGAAREWAAAGRRCAERGGYLPSANELMAAAGRVRLASYLTDDPAKATVDSEPSDGMRDLREMTSTLVTTQGGDGAAGALGVSPGSKGDPRLGEPDPPEQPADPAPESLQYVTVVDNGDRGGAAGSRPITQAERFRCAFHKGLEGAAPAPVPTEQPSAKRRPSLDAPSKVAADALRAGVTARVACPRDCTYLIELRLKSTTARRFVLTEKRKGMVVLAATGRKPSSLDGGSSVRRRLRPSAGVADRLVRGLRELRLPSVTAQVRATVKPAGGRTQTLTRALRIER